MTMLRFLIHRMMRLKYVGTAILTLSMYGYIFSLAPRVCRLGTVVHTVPHARPRRLYFMSGACHMVVVSLNKQTESPPLPTTPYRC